MPLVIIALIFILLSLKWGDWKNWRLYYPTILMYIIATLSSNLLTYKKELCIIRGSFWNDILANYFIACVIFPCIIVIYSRYASRGEGTRITM